MPTSSIQKPTETLPEKYAPYLPLILEREGDKRYHHTLAVAEECLALGELFSLSDIDQERLYVAGLFHDITKTKNTEEQLALAERLGVKLTDADIASPPVLHALTGAALVREEFSACCDDEVAKAIESHTTGKPGMTLLGKLLFLADTIEPTRKQPACRIVRERFYRSIQNPAVNRRKLLDRTLLGILKSTASYVRKGGHAVHPQTKKTIDWLNPAKKG